ncbi:MAG: DciA family protein [Armatimonadota bacterium]
MRQRWLRRGNLSRAGSLVSSALGRLGAQEKVLEQQAVAKWPQVVGPQVAAASKAERVMQGVLFVACKSSTWASELSLHKDRIVKRINDSLGTTVVKDIRFSARGFRQAKETKSEREEKVEAVGLAQPDIEKAKQISRVCSSPELASLVERAVLTSKRLGKLRGRGETQSAETGG